MIIDFVGSIIVLVIIGMLPRALPIIAAAT